MANILKFFENLEKILSPESQSHFVSSNLRTITKDTDTKISFMALSQFLQDIFNDIDAIATELKKDETLLVSVKNQKTLRTCFQLITSLGVSRCLIPGLGINLSKRCLSAAILHPLTLTDEEKYEMLTECTDFFTRCYVVPVLKNIIVTLHLSDYLAALIQLSFAPLKKPGTYNNFIMTQELYGRLNIDRKKYQRVYENLVENCFQPILMKELLVLQGVTDPQPPAFVKRVIAKEMSSRLLAPGGLLSLIRCFIESYGIDSGFEWKKIDLICKIVAAKHGNGSENDYLSNICSQLKNILMSKNTHYLATAIACVLVLNETYPQSEAVKGLVKNIFQTLVYDELSLRQYLPGTIALSALEVERAINMLHACVYTTKLEWPAALLHPNLYLLFMIGVKCTKNVEMKTKIKEILLKLLETLCQNNVRSTMIKLLFGHDEGKNNKISVEEYEAGIAVKFVSDVVEYPRKDALSYFITLFKASTNLTFVQAIFESSLQILIDLTEKRKENRNKNMLLTPEDGPILLDNIDEKYVDILQLLSEICTYPKVISTLKDSPAGVLNFIEYFLMRNFGNSDDECVTIALVLLNTILENSSENKDTEKMFNNITPVLKRMAEDESALNNILCKEALSLIKCNKPQQPETACAKAIADVFDPLLPVRAHGIIELTKLIDAKNPEAISKKHFIFCLFQDQLKDTDSYVYLAAINGIASLGSLCTEDVLHVLCKEFIQIADQPHIQTTKDQNSSAELKMKIGDIIVKVTRKLGEIAVMHKTILLNTMLSACRHEDPFMRASALSNLAEIALVLHYRVGSIIYEILLCVWSIIETDPAVECRRAAVMVISSLLKGLGKDTLIELKDNLLPIYRTLKDLYRDPDEDPTVRLHAQIALEELNDIVKQFLTPTLSMDRSFVLGETKDIVFK
ncbi:transport and Golgi organization protein 6 [Leguminivora glycinivorella]|uniref:transport and Golgi organization protein 6 n=1 Tax=Leguminivora glycinivorella TaxID=1035111 RepID=UPI00200FB10A|nr:transport and Golgi organization protein 6 [Leguminivora glycinivorella]